MPTDEIPMPPLPIVQNALRVTTERLAAELAAPGAEAPDWTPFEWRAAMAVAAMHGISALLAGRLRWHGPASWTSFLAEQKEQGLLRQQRTQQLLAGIDAAARQAQIPLLALKGSALLDLALYSPGERPMSDIDLLSREQDLAASGRLIQALGYEEGMTMWKHIEYQPIGTAKDRAFGEHIGNPIKIELHGRIMERLPLRNVAITAQVFPPSAHPGLNPYPSLAALMRHLLLHAAGNMCFQSMRLIHLHDIAALAGRLQTSDWDELMQPGEDGQKPWWILPPLALVDRYFAGRIPAQLLSHAALRCPPLLRWVSKRHRIVDISLSKLSIPMLPGVAWSRSTTEAFAWALNRLYPGRQTVAAYKKAALGEHIPTVTGWAQLSRWQKGLRILTRSSPRPQTMYSVQRALSYRPASSPYKASSKAAL